MFQRVCALDDVWEGEIAEFTVGTQDVIVVNAEGVGLRAFDARCPHQDQSLGEADLQGCILTCPAHLWQFDTTTGEGVNPTGSRMRRYPLKIEGDDVLVDVEVELEMEEEQGV